MHEVPRAGHEIVPLGEDPLTRKEPAGVETPSDVPPPVDEFEGPPIRSDRPNLNLPERPDRISIGGSNNPVSIAKSGLFDATIGRLLGRSTQVVTADGQKVRVSTNSLVKQVVDSNPKIGDLLKKDPAVRAKVLAMLKPFVNEDIQAKDIVQLRDDLSNMAEGKPLSSFARDQNGLTNIQKTKLDQLEKISDRKTPTVEWSENWARNQHLVPGDIVFVQMRQHGDAPVHPVDRLIRWTQTLASNWMHGKQEANADSNIHVGIYVGDGKIAESTLSGTVVLPLGSEDWTLNPNDSLQYRVVRPKNPDLAKAAASVAKEIGYEPRRPDENLSEAPIKHKYSIALGANSFFHSTSFGENAKRRLFAAYAQNEIAGLGPEDATGKKRDFYCSYFIGWSLQNAEARAFIAKATKENPLLAPPELPADASAADKKKFTAEVNKWSLMMARYHGDILSPMTMQFDSKHMSPQKLRSIMMENPDSFQDLLTVVPRPKSSQ